MYFSKLIKSDDEVMIEIGKNVDYERELQIDSTKSRMIEFGLDFVEKLKIEVERKFWMKKSRFYLKLNQIELEILIEVEIKHDRKVDYENCFH